MYYVFAVRRQLASRLTYESPFYTGNVETPQPNNITPATGGVNEPIYESVLPKEEGVATSPLPIPAQAQKPRTKSPGIDRVQRTRSDRSTSPKLRQSESPQFNSRPSSRGSCTVSISLALNYIKVCIHAILINIV